MALGFLLLPPSGTDLTAQQARAGFAAAHPGAAVDLRWYAGVHPAAYSVLAPYVQAVLGVRLTAALAAVAAALLLALLLLRWRVRRPLLASVWGAVALTGEVLSGRTTFALGLALGLGALAAVPAPRARRARWLPAVALAVATALTSPVAALFLGLAAVAWALRRRDVLVLGVAAGAPLLAVAALFPEPGRMPYTWGVAWPVLLATFAVAVLCRPAPVRLAAVLYFAGALVVYLVPGPLGSNVERLAVIMAGPVLVACARAPRVLLLPVLAVVGWWTLLVPARDLGHSASLARERTAAERLVPILRGLGPVTGRVEVVPLADHSEATVVGDAWPLARGWERQVDVERSRLFYSGRLTPARYRDWLDRQAVQYVALARHRHDWSARGEVRLLAAAPAWLVPVHHDAEWQVWRVANARPLVEPPGRLVAVSADRVVFVAQQAAQVPVAVHWSRWLTVSGDACLRRSGDRVAVEVRRPGPVTLSSSYAALWRPTVCR